MSKHYAMCYFDDESGNYVPMEVRPESDHLNLVAENAMLKAELKAINAALDDPQTDITMTACEVISALKEQIAQLEREFKIEFGDLHDSYIEQKETIAKQADELSESQKHINHLRMALADAEALELGTCERLAKARSMLAEQAEAMRVKDAVLNRIMLNGWGLWVVEDVSKALATQPNPDILRERDEQAKRLVESVARAVYMQWCNRDGYLPWQDGGNSLMQDSARHIAELAIAAAPKEK